MDSNQIAFEHNWIYYMHGNLLCKTLKMTFRPLGILCDGKGDSVYDAEKKNELLNLLQFQDAYVP